MANASYPGQDYVWNYYPEENQERSKTVVVLIFNLLSAL
jgi:hypothetical protein